MKQLNFFTETNSNLDRKVKEDYNSIEESKILQIISYMWEKNINRFGFTEKQILDTYKKLGYNNRDIFQFVYYPKDMQNRSKRFILIKEDVAYTASKINDKRNYSVSQFIEPYEYFRVSANKVFSKLFFEKYPILDKKPFVYYVEKKVDIDSLMCRSITSIPELSTLQLGQLLEITRKKNGLVDFLTKKEKRSHITVYFDSDWLFLGYSNENKTHRCLYYNIDIDSFLKGDINTILGKDLNSNEYFLKNLSDEDKEYRTNNEIVNKFFNVVKNNALII